MANAQFVWLDGKFVKYDQARVPLLTHSLQYGSGVFEGIRCYNTAKGPAIFRLHDHTLRLFDSAKIYSMPIKYRVKEIEEATKQLIKKNGLTSAYIRPFIFYNYVGIGYRTKGKQTSVAIAALEFGNLFGEKHKGLNCKIVSWQRINSSILPPGSKASGNYLNSLLASQEADNSGYDEAILMTRDGHIAEGPGENIFAVKGNVLITPPKSADILLGITRDTVIKIAESMGLEVEERDVRREELYTSDEAFFTGTAAEITPILSVDSRTLGSGKAGPIATMISERYTKIVNGEDKEFIGWLSFLD